MADTGDFRAEHIAGVAALSPEQIENLGHLADALGGRADRLRTLVEFADNVAAGRRVLKLIAWVGGVATGAAVLLYYLLAIRNGWNVPRARR